MSLEFKIWTQIRLAVTLHRKQQHREIYNTWYGFEKKKKKKIDPQSLGCTSFKFASDNHLIHLILLCYLSSICSTTIYQNEVVSYSSCPLTQNTTSTVAMVRKRESSLLEAGPMSTTVTLDRIIKLAFSSSMSALWRSVQMFAVIMMIHALTPPGTRSRASAGLGNQKEVSQIDLAAALP